jgi:hypothetical protein
MTKQKPLLLPSVPNAPAYLRRMPTKAEVPADLIVVHNSVKGKAAPRLERLSRMACASGGALRSVRLQMGGAPRRSLPRGTGWVMRFRASRSSASQVVCRFRCHLALAARPKCVLHGGPEFLVHPFELLGR